MQVELTKTKEIIYKKSIKKRIFDIVFSFIALILLSPVFILLGLLNSLLSPGPIFFCQERVGYKSKSIRCWKFRTMYIESDKILKNSLKKDPLLREEWGKYLKLRKDPRVTPFGLFLRKYSLDELPQFWNVLKGDLSIVGPRPWIAWELERIPTETVKKILSTRPGITGLWQTSGRNNLGWKERAQMDASYVSQQSFFKDIQLILKTFIIMFSPKGGAY